MDLEYSFETPIDRICDLSSNGGLVSVQATSGETYQAQYVVSTIPLNVLHSIVVEPPLSPLRQEAISIGHVNMMNKIHAEVEGDALMSWNGMKLDNHIMFGYGDDVLDNGNAHLVGFGADVRDDFIAERDPEKVVQAFEALHPMNIKKTVSTRWENTALSC